MAAAHEHHQNQNKLRKPHPTLHPTLHPTPHITTHHPRHATHKHTSHHPPTHLTPLRHAPTAGSDSSSHVPPLHSTPLHTHTHTHGRLLRSGALADLRAQQSSKLQNAVRTGPGGGGERGQNVFLRVVSPKCALSLMEEPYRWVDSSGADQTWSKNGFVSTQP